MEVDIVVNDSASNTVSSDVSNLQEKPIDFATTTNVIDLAHNSPITESSCADAVDNEILSHSRSHTGHVQKYPRHIEPGASAKHACHGSSNGRGDPDSIGIHGWGELNTNTKYSMNGRHPEKWSNSEWVTSDHQTNWRAKNMTRRMKIVIAVLQGKI